MAVNKQWWDKLSRTAKQEYLRSHPKSKFRGKKTSPSSASAKPKPTFSWVKKPRL